MINEDRIGRDGKGADGTGKDGKGTVALLAGRIPSRTGSVRFVSQWSEL